MSICLTAAWALVCAAELLFGELPRHSSGETITPGSVFMAFLICTQCVIGDIFFLLKWKKENAKKSG